jgi:predicted  nucleic acid-binding Zn-ribbon protein
VGKIEIWKVLSNQRHRLPRQLSNKQVKEHVDEHGELRLRVQKLETNIRASEDETKHNQETVQRLLEDLDRTRKVMANADQLKDVRELIHVSINAGFQERDAATRQQERLQDELKLMEQRMHQTRDSHETLHKDLREKQMKMSELDAEIRKRDMHTSSTAQEFKLFKVG